MLKHINHTDKTLWYYKTYYLAGYARALLVA